MIKGKAECAFGTGDIRTTTALFGKVGVYVLDNQLPHKIGEHQPVDDNFTFTNKDVMLTFTKLESVDVVINDLLEIKRLMIEGGEGGKEIHSEPSDFWGEYIKSDFGLDSNVGTTLGGTHENKYSSNNHTRTRRNI